MRDPHARDGVLERLIEWSAHNRLLVGLVTGVVERVEDLGGVVRGGPRLSRIRLNACLAKSGKVVAADLFVLGHRFSARRTKSLRLASSTMPEGGEKARGGGRSDTPRFSAWERRR